MVGCSAQTVDGKSGKRQIQLLKLGAVGTDYSLASIDKLLQRPTLINRHKSTQTLRRQRSHSEDFVSWVEGLSGQNSCISS
eukprot:COSAG03_NODE_15735_length_422_cov_0.631579_1_plen_80_part_01